MSNAFTSVGEKRSHETKKRYIVHNKNLNCAAFYVLTSLLVTSTVTSGYLLVANRLYLHRISLDGTRKRVVAGGLDFAISVDYHFRNNSLYWIDSSRRVIMKSSLDGLKRSIVFDHGLTEPGNVISFGLMFR